MTYAEQFEQDLQNGLLDDQPIATDEDLEYLERGEVSACCGAPINDFGYCTDCKEHAA